MTPTRHHRTGRVAAGLCLALAAATVCPAQPPTPGGSPQPNSIPLDGSAPPRADGLRPDGLERVPRAHEEQPADASSAAPAASAAAPRSGSRPTWQGLNHPQSVFPPAPQAFFRGNPLGPGLSVAGRYLNMLLLVPVLGVFALWAYYSYWIQEDSSALKLRTEFWNSIMLGCGVLGFLAMLCLPHPAVGFLALNLFWGVPLGLYVHERNGRVPESARVMTPEHIQKVVTRWLARLGIHVGSREVREAAIGAPIRFIGKSSTGLDEDTARTRQVESSKGILAAKELMYDAILRRATDVHLEPKEGEMSIRLRIDGVMYPTEPFDRPMGESIINVFKVLSAMDITERRRPQDGSFRAELEDRDIDFRVATQGTRHGQKMSIRILDQSQSVSKLDDLGFRKQLFDAMREIVHQPHGMFVVCGPTGAGKSTTLYAALNDIDSFQRNIITVEDPIEYKIDNVNQIEINTRAGQTFATSLRSILRQDPDVVMIGEIRDQETAEIACQAANTGHMVFSTVHANDSLTALYRLQELGVEPFMIANSISGILAQRLTRRLCPDCREAYKPKPEFLKQAGLPVDKVDRFYRPPKQPPGVCAKCGGLGFYGRLGVFELLVITDRMRDLIRDKAPAQAIKAEARKNGMLTMKEEGLRLVVKGVTSIDELLRVVK
ncbi:MAG TPA: GspE/PulE family protein [Planctomycetaceae bacterium]|nr:GspE/PulE family protein [Planctomycetaceae bacterium]